MELGIYTPVGVYCDDEEERLTLAPLGESKGGSLVATARRGAYGTLVDVEVRGKVLPLDLMRIVKAIDEWECSDSPLPLTAEF